MNLQLSNCSQLAKVGKQRDYAIVKSWAKNWLKKHILIIDSMDGRTTILKHIDEKIWNNFKSKITSCECNAHVIAEINMQV